MAQRKTFSKEEIEEHYINADASMRQACEALECCPTVLVRELKRLGMPSKSRVWNHRRKNRFPKLQDKEWLAQQLKTRTMLDIATELGTSSGNVSDHVKRHGLRWKHYDRIEAVKEGLKKAALKRGAPRITNWKGGRIANGAGYIYAYAPNHPRATKDGYVMEHRLVMENSIGRQLEPNEIVHHRNGNKADNRLENLELHNKSTHVHEHFDAYKRTQELITRVEQLELILKQHGIEEKK